MQVSINVYDNFVKSINSEQTKEQYEYCLIQFLKYCQINLDSFLKLPHDEISSQIVNYLVHRKVSRQYKIVIFSAIKHACEMNDVILNWKKLKKGEPPAPDHDQWLSCYSCGNTYPIHETFAESQIRDSLETVSSPYEANEAIFLTTDSRATQRRKGKRPKSKRFRDMEKQDPEIQPEIDKGNIVNILYDSSN